MSVRFILGRGGSGKSTHILKKIRDRVQDDETSPVILLVPEQYTFEMEKRMSNLFTGEKKDKYLRARVLSFKTMSNIVFSNVGGLTDININASGKAMMTYRAIESVSEELDIFSKSSSQSGFVSSISDIIGELKQYNITPERLEETANEVESETLRLKLKDVSKIYKEFENKLHENYVDSQDLLNSLGEKLVNCDYFKDAYIYIDEFTGFTPNQYKVLKNIFHQAKEVCISLTIDNPYNISYNKSDPFSRTKFTYQKLVKLCNEEGIKLEASENLNDIIHRFENVKELIHLEKYYHSYPYKTYEEETENIKIKEFNNLYSEVEEIAKEIVSIVRDKNIRYRDITIATRDLNKYDFLIHSIFTEYNIPHFIDKKREAKSNPIIVLIIAVLEMKNRRYSYETMFRYLKSGLLGISDGDISLLENYVLANGIKGKKWFEEKWEYGLYHNIVSGESEYEIYVREKVNEIKDKVLAPIIKLQENLKGKNTVEDICKYVYEFLIDINMPETIENLIMNFKEKGQLDIANQYAQVWDIVIGILDQMVEIMGTENISLDKYIRVINLGFDEYELGLVPPSIDQVLVSSVDRMKNSSTKYLYLIGTTDGTFPLIAKDNGLLNDSDRELLGKNGVEVDIDSKTKTFEEQYLVYKALTSTSENLIVTYPISDHEGKTLRPSIIISRLKKLFTNINHQSYLLEEKLDNDEAIINSITTKVPTFNNLINEAKEYDEGKKINDIWLDVYRYYAKDEEYKDITTKVISGLTYTNQVQKVEEEKIKKLYENTPLSVSKLETYAKCPFAYFMQYGLKAKERKEYSFTAPDLGTFIHNILDTFSNQMIKDRLSWRDIQYDYIIEEVSKIVDEIVNKIPGYILDSSARYRYLAYRLKKMLITAISIISEQIKQGSFEPSDYEVDFSDKGKYPPIKIILSNGEEIKLRGQIDRVDSFEDEEGKYIRIIDYKSSKRDLSLTEIFHGLQLQLLVYLDAILESSKNTSENLQPAAILYSEIDDPIAKFDENKEDDEIRESILKKLKMQGMVIKDPKILKEMDKALDNGEKASSLIIPASINKDGTISKSTKGVTKEEFEVIRKYVKGIIKELCEDMLGGNIDISPYKHKQQTPCGFCDYSSICQFDSSLKDNGYKIINKKSDDNIINMMKGGCK